MADKTDPGKLYTFYGGKQPLIHFEGIELQALPEAFIGNLLFFLRLCLLYDA